MYTHAFFFRFLSHVAHHRLFGGVPCTIQQVPIGQAFHIPQCAYANPKSIPHPIPLPPLLPFGYHKFFKVSVLQITSFVFFFFLRFHIKCYHVCLSLTSLSMIISRSIHVAADAIISLFVMAK